MRAPWTVRAGRVAALVALLLPASASAGPTFSDTGFAYQPLVTGLPRPTAVAWTPDGRMLIATKDGKVFVATRDGNGNLTGDASQIIDISDRVNRYGDRGLLGLAVDSDYASNHYIYFLHTYEEGSDPGDAGPKASQLRRVVLNPDNSVGPSTVILGANTSQVPCPAPSNTLECIPSDSPSHSIGTVRADADGTLWVGSGDGADYGGMDQRAFRTFDETSYAGKILHIDRNGQGLAGHPFCTNDSDLSHVCTKLYAKGFRNPFRFTLRNGGAGPAVGDVGWNTREELDMLPSLTDTTTPRDFGWPCYEGKITTPAYNGNQGCFSPDQNNQSVYHGPVTPPVYDFAHSDGAVAVVGGPTYYGTQFPAAYRGATLFGDYGSGVMRRYDPGNGQVSQVAAGAGAWVDLESAPAGLSYAAAGDVVYVNINDFSDTGGSVGRVYYATGNHAPVASMSGTTPTSGQAPLLVNFHGEQSSDVDGGSLTYDWDFGDGTSLSDAGPTPPAHPYATGGLYIARLTVSDAGGLTGRAMMQINAGAPTVTLLRPLAGSLYRDGTAVPLQGSAKDANDQPIPDSGLSWHVVLHHLSHTHDLGLYTGSSTSFNPLTDHDANSHYDVTLTATDSKGVSASKAVSIYPETVKLTIASSPSGAPVTYAGANQTAPVTVTTAVGFTTSISAAFQFQEGSTSYAFASWSDGRAASHDITVPAADTTLTATYTPLANSVNAPLSGGEALSPPAPSVAGTTTTSTTSPDRTGPALTFDASATNVRRGRLSGKASDQSGVSKVQVALRSQGTRRGCRWWSLSSRRLARSLASCRSP
ncbi:MAG: hypothetical protein QOK04_1734, partial [Solirubrobacteraceae bacterium]|nr:hypothetical protein [Solirubrobacteraceae bacterium]